MSKGGGTDEEGTDEGRGYVIETGTDELNIEQGISNVE